MLEKTGRQKVVVVGAGPVGALAALYAAERGDDVNIYELREDLRDHSTTPLNFTKSINLALSERGINSLKQARNAALVDSVLEKTLPIYGRMIHARNKLGELAEESQVYDVHGRAIFAVDRAGLNKQLLDYLEKMPNVTFFFNHKLTGADFERKIAWFEEHVPLSRDGQKQVLPNHSNMQDHWRAPEIEVRFDLLIGADGAHSATRYNLMKFARVNYHQEYIDTLWCEFRIQPLNSTFAISPNHLHIWPAGSSMFIAIPSLDKSFTCTLFAPSSTFAYLSHSPSTNIPAFFADRFPGVSPQFISLSDVISQFSNNPHLPLISIKCTPHHYGSSVVILGDAAHAMVPFYGQGMNAGLEDVRVLFDFLDRFNVYATSKETSISLRSERRAEALSAYTIFRVPDAAAINDLALRNYHEMSSSVQSPAYRLRKFIEERINKYCPALGWSTQYSRVSFGNERYSEVHAATQRQKRDLIIGAVALVGLGILWPIRWGYWRWQLAGT